MPLVTIPAIAVIQFLENETRVAEALFFPEVIRIGASDKKTIESLKANLTKIAGEIPFNSLHQRLPSGPVEIRQIVFNFAPSKRTLAWRNQIRLRFPALCWQYGDQTKIATKIAYVPALGIEIVGYGSISADEFDKKIEAQIIAAINRSGLSNSIGDLIWLQRSSKIRVEDLSVGVQLPTPKQTAIKTAEIEDQKRSALNEAATDLTKEKLLPAYETGGLIERMAETVAGKTPESLLLVGKSGSGKTAAVYELVRRRQDFQLGHTPFYATSGSQLISGMSAFGQWQERCQSLWREATEQRAILYIGNLVELMEVGKNSSSAQGIASFLRPYIARGDVLTIAECTPEQLTMIERIDPRLIQSFTQIKVEEPTNEISRSILLSVALEYAGEISIDLEAIERIDQLHRRYASYSAYPGRPLRFLRHLIQDRILAGGIKPELSSDDVLAAFSKQTGLPLILLDEKERLDQAAAETWFSERIIGQKDAIDLIVNLIATVKAGLTKPNKPIASLLFIGPTGVGKTEMAKSLAEFLFQDRRRMVRFDLSEYSDPVSVNRLIGGVFGAEGQLTSLVREQPFSVLLLDEFEKAHHSFFDLLLQVLGEGRLTDARGRVADFSNTVVIMTSNLGAESFQRGLSGFKRPGISREETQRHFTNAVRQSLRPEIFNRIDRIVPFSSLDEESVFRIATREIEQLGKRDGLLYRDIRLNVSEEVIRYLAVRGYDARYGARPLKRSIERNLIVPLSEKLNHLSTHAASNIDVYLDQKIKFTVRPVNDEGGRQINQHFNDRSITAMARQFTELRRMAQSLEHSPTKLNLNNEIYQLQRISRRLEKSDWKNPEDLNQVARLPRLQAALHAIEEYSSSIKTTEQEILFSIYGKSLLIDADLYHRKLEALKVAWRNLIFDTYALNFRNPNAITLAVFSNDAASLLALSRAYYKIARKHGAEIEIYKLLPNSKISGKSNKAPGQSQYLKIKMDAPERYFENGDEHAVGIVFGITAPLAMLKFENERGIHIFINKKTASRCFVYTGEIETLHFEPSLDALSMQDKRRIYDGDSGEIDDPAVKSKAPSTKLEDDILGMMEKYLLKQAESIIEE